MTDYRQLTEDIYKAINELTKFDCFEIAEKVKKGDNSFSGSLFNYKINKSIKTSIKNYLKGEFVPASYYAWEAFYTFASNQEIKAAIDFKFLGNLYLKVNSFLDRVKAAKEEFVTDFKEELLKSNLFKDDDFKDTEIPLNYIFESKESFDDSNKELRIYSMKEDIDTDVVNKPVVYKNHIVATTNPLDLTTKTYSENVTVSVGLCIEEIIDYSYFIFNIQYKNNQWILTDKIEFKNPAQGGKRRNPRRTSEDRERANSLPYNLIDEVIEKRENTEDVTKAAGSEIYTFDFMSMSEGQRLSLYLNIKNALAKIQEREGKFEKMHTALEMANETDSFEDTFDDINKEECQRIYDELFPKSQELAVIPKTVALRYANEAPGALVTTEEFKSNVNWLIAKEEADRAKETFYKPKQDSDGFWGPVVDDDQRKALIAMIESNIEKLYPCIFSGDEVYLHNVDVPKLNSRDFTAYSDPEKAKEFEYLNHARLFARRHSEGHNVDMYTSKRICRDCNKTKITNSEQFMETKFSRYTDFIGLFGIEREELPEAFRMYLSNSEVPYIGNTALRNINPKFELLGRDPASCRWMNGITYGTAMCKKCQNKLYKKYKIAEKSVIVISSKQKKILETISLDEFKKRYVNNK